jgi:hypothetical protein
MEIEFGYTREDWVQVNTSVYKAWLYAQRPLSGSEYCVCWVFFLFSLFAGVALLAGLVAAVWLSLAWYFVVGALVLFVFVCGMFLEVVRPIREPVRGLLHELIFRWGLEAKLLDKVRGRRVAHFRRLDAKGELDLRHRYRLRIDAEGLTLATEYPSSSGAATRQEDRIAWSAVSTLTVDDHLLSIMYTDGRCIYVPRGAFAGEEDCKQFLRVAEDYRTRPAAASAAIQGPRGAAPAVREDAYAAAAVTAGRSPGA